MLRRPGGLRARRPRHPFDRALLRCLRIVSFPTDASTGPTEEDQRQRVVDADGRADAVAVPQRPCIPASCPPPARASVPVPAGTVELQRALPVADTETCAALEGDRGRDAWRPRSPAPARHDPAPLRPVDPDDQDERARAVGRLRVLPGTLPPLLGLQARAAVRSRRHDRRLRPRPRERARTRRRARAARSQPDRGRHDHLRQRLRRGRVRSSRPRAPRPAAATKSSRRTRPAPIRRSAGSDNGSNRSSTPSKTSSCSSVTAAAPPPAFSPG